MPPPGQAAERRITLDLTPEARELLYREGWDPAYGARPLRRAIQRLIQDPLALRIPEGVVLPGELVRVGADLGAGRMKFESASAKAASSA